MSIIASLPNSVHKTWPDGSQTWVEHGEYHCVDGPAIIWADGHKEWWVNGLLHRVDGPAIEETDGVNQWYLFGYRRSKKTVLKFQQKIIAEFGEENIQNIPYGVLKMSYDVLFVVKRKR